MEHLKGKKYKVVKSFTVQAPGDVSFAQLACPQNGLIFYLH
jgi:hypothetical protein